MTTEEIAGRSGASKAMPLAGMALPVVSAKRVYINDGGVASDQRLAAPTVGQLLAAALRRSCRTTRWCPRRRRKLGVSAA